MYFYVKFNLTANLFSSTFSFECSIRSENAILVFCSCSRKKQSKQPKIRQISKLFFFVLFLVNFVHWRLWRNKLDGWDRMEWYPGGWDPAKYLMIYVGKVCEWDESGQKFDWSPAKISSLVSSSWNELSNPRQNIFLKLFKFAPCFLKAFAKSHLTF